MYSALSRVFSKSAIAIALIADASIARADFLFTISTISISPQTNVGTGASQFPVEATSFTGPQFADITGYGTSNADTFYAGSVSFDPGITSITTSEAALTDIGFNVAISFVAPLSGTVTAMGDATATSGIINPASGTYSISFGQLTGTLSNGDVYHVLLYGTTPGTPIILNAKSPSLAAINGEIYVTQQSNAPVPEPSSMVLLGVGGVVSAIAAYRRRRATT